MLTIYQMEMGLIHNVKRVVGIELLMRNQMKKRLSKSGIYIGRKMPNDGKGIREQMSQ